MRRASQPRSKLKLSVAALCLLLAVAAGVGVVRSISSPAEGTITTSKVPVARAQPGLGSSLTVQGRTVTFQHPAILRQTQANELDVGDVEKFTFVNSHIPSWNLAIQIRNLPSGQLADDGSYYLRSHHPDQYHEQQLVINGQNVSIMSDQSGGFAKAVFMVHGGLVAELSLSSNSSGATDQLNQALNVVLNSWRWL